MILDELNNWHRYAALGPRFEKAFTFLQSFNAATPPGRIELDGINLYASVMSHPTRPVEQCRFEAHRRYADIQFIVTGRERIDWAPLSALPTVTQPYDADKDLIFFARPALWSPLHLCAGQFAVFFPEDGHAPMCEFGGIGEVRKVVMKVRI